MSRLHVSLGSTKRPSGYRKTLWTIRGLRERLAEGPGARGGPQFEFLPVTAARRGG